MASLEIVCGVAFLGFWSVVLCHALAVAQEQPESASVAAPTSTASAYEVPPPPPAAVAFEPAEPAQGPAAQPTQGPSNSVAPSAAAGTTQTNAFDAGTLERFFAGVVQVRCGDNWATGFAYPTASHVVTVLSAVNDNCVPTVTRADGYTQKARVVAWSVEDDVAILEVKQVVAHQPVLLAPARPAIASPVAVLRVQARRVGPDAAPSPEDFRPVPRFGHIVGAHGDVLLVESSFSVGDEGAPVITASGEVIGVFRYATPHTVPAATPAEKVERLAQRIGGQGEFEADPPALRGWHSGVFFSPLSTDDAIGGGVISGYRYGWFAGQLDVTLLHSSFALVDGAAQSMTRVSVDVYATLLVPLARNGAFFLAPGASAGVESSKRTQLDDLNVEPEKKGAPFLAGRVAFGTFDGPLLVRGVVGFPDPFYRTDLGVYFDAWRKPRP